MAVMILVSHEVKDFASWKKGFEAGKGMRDAAGVTTKFVGQDAGKPNLVHLGFESPSAEAAQALLSNPKLKEDMAAAGVVSAPDIRMVNLG